MRGIVNDPVRAMLKSQVRFDMLTDILEQHPIRPAGVRHKVVQCLVLRGHIERIGMRRQRFDTFTLNRQHQPTAVFEQTLVSRRIAQTFAQMRI